MVKYIGRISHSEDIANKQYVDDQVEIAFAIQNALNNKADKSQVLTNVPANAKFTDTTYTAGTGINITGDVISATGGGSDGYDDTSVVNHMSDRTNPHNVTKSQVGLGNLDDVKQASKVEFDNHNQDNTRHITASERNSWNNKQDALGFTAENISNKGQAGGYASLDATGRVPVSQLPDFEGGSGDSSVEVEQARVDASGHTNATLKERLDKEHTEVTTQLAQKAQQSALEVERARINNLTANAGDVTNNAELLDVRVGYDGVIYSTAGEAVRQTIGAFMTEENESWEV